MPDSALVDSRPCRNKMCRRSLIKILSQFIFSVASLASLTSGFTHSSQQRRVLVGFGKVQHKSIHPFSLLATDNYKGRVDPEGATGGLLSAEQFARNQKIDATIRDLATQLPLTLSKPLKLATAQNFFDKNVELKILVDSEEIDLLNNLEELVSLSDILVISTAAAQQANSVFGGGSSTKIECQLVIDPYGQSLVIPWKATVPVIPGSSPSTIGINQFEGLSEFRLNTEGKVRKHIIRKVSWNGQSLQGPTIGQSLRALQSTMNNLQRSPIFRGSNALLEQAAAAASLRNRPETQAESADVLLVDQIRDIDGWVDGAHRSNFSSVPVPGTDAWEEYEQNHIMLTTLIEDIIPLLSSPLDVTKYFDQHASLRDTKGKILLQGQEYLSNFFQSLALARKGTGGSWLLQNCTVLDWRERKVSLNYVETNSPWTITGRDTYALSTKSDFPLIQEIRQEEISVSTSDGGVSLDGLWVMKNLASAVERSSSPTTIAPVIRNLFSDVLFQPNQATILQKKTRQEVSQKAAANMYYLMADLHDILPQVINSTLPPATNYFSDSIELKGYLGETILRGAVVYNRAIGSLLATTRGAISQKRLILESNPSPRVELTPSGKVRVSLMLAFRVPGPISAPLVIELVSDYVVDQQTGFVVTHQLVETRVNGQLTPGDVISRNLAGFLNVEMQQGNPSRSPDEVLQTVSEAVSWLRTLAMAPNNGSK